LYDKITRCVEAAHACLLSELLGTARLNIPSWGLNMHLLCLKIKTNKRDRGPPPTRDGLRPRLLAGLCSYEKMRGGAQQDQDLNPGAQTRMAEFEVVPRPSANVFKCSDFVPFFKAHVTRQHMGRRMHLVGTEREQTRGCPPRPAARDSKFFIFVFFF
jgi:hypothetical protein